MLTMSTAFCTVSTTRLAYLSVWLSKNGNRDKIKTGSCVILTVLLHSGWIRVRASVICLAYQKLGAAVGDSLFSAGPHPFLDARRAFQNFPDIQTLN